MVADVISALPSSPTRAKIPSGGAHRGRALLEDHFDLIQHRLRRLSRRSSLPEADAEDFRSWALLKLVEDDYRILASWQGRSSLSTYLTVVLVNLMRDYRIHVWGKWRPSAAARRWGREGVLLERLWLRDGLPLDEAITQMRIKHGIALSSAELERIAAGFPRRAGRRWVSEEELLHVPADGQVEDRIKERERGETAARLQELLPALLGALPAESRRLIELSYRDGQSMTAIASELGKSPRELYSLRDRCLKKLRQALETAGLSADRVNGLAGRLSWELQPKGGRT
jgi:RNA polymerase sigma factor (sigma-70 family)